MFYRDLAAVFIQSDLLWKCREWIQFLVKIISNSCEEFVGLCGAHHCKDHSCLTSIYVFQFLKEVATTCLFCKWLFIGGQTVDKFCFIYVKSFFR